MPSPSPAERREMARLYLDERLSLARVAERTFWSATAVRRALMVDGIPPRPQGANCGPNHRALSERQLDETVELYQQGLSLDAVAERLGLVRDTVKYRLAKAGVPLRGRSSTLRLYHLRQIATRDDLRDTTRAILDAVAATPGLTTAEVARRAGHLPRNTIRTLKLLEQKGLVASRRRPSPDPNRPARLYVWRRTSLATRDVLSASLDEHDPNGRGDMWLRIDPFRDWLNGLVADGRRGALFLAVTPSRSHNGDGTGGISIESAIATRLKLDERRLYALRYEQKSITLSLADRCLTLAGDGTCLWDLWPELASEDELEDAPRSYHGFAA